jgi:hypothetical protein
VNITKFKGKQFSGILNTFKLYMASSESISNVIPQTHKGMSHRERIVELNRKLSYSLHCFSQGCFPERKNYNTKQVKFVSLSKRARIQHNLHDTIVHGGTLCKYHDPTMA